MGYHGVYTQLFEGQETRGPLPKQHGLFFLGSSSLKSEVQTELKNKVYLGLAEGGKYPMIASTFSAFHLWPNSPRSLISTPETPP